jgi:hypothetical protein
MRGYNANNYVDPSERSVYTPPPEGEHFVRIDSAEWKKTRTDKDMIAITLTVKDYDGHMMHHITDNGNKFWDWELGDLFDSFGINPGDFNFLNWRGKVGKVIIKHDPSGNKTYAKIKDYVLKSRQGGTPAETPQNASNGEPWETW